MKSPILIFKSGSTDLIVISTGRFPLTIVIGMVNSAASSGGLEGLRHLGPGAHSRGFSLGNGDYGCQ